MVRLSDVPAGGRQFVTWSGPVVGICVVVAPGVPGATTGGGVN